MEHMRLQEELDASQQRQVDTLAGPKQQNGGEGATPHSDPGVKAAVSTPALALVKSLPKIDARDKEIQEGRAEENCELSDALAALQNRMEAIAPSLLCFIRVSGSEIVVGDMCFLARQWLQRTGQSDKRLRCHRHEDHTQLHQ